MAQTHSVASDRIDQKADSNGLDADEQRGGRPANKRPVIFEDIALSQLMKICDHIYMGLDSLSIVEMMWRMHVELHDPMINNTIAMLSMVQLRSTCDHSYTSTKQRAGPHRRQQGLHPQIVCGLEAKVRICRTTSMSERL